MSGYTSLHLFSSVRWHKTFWKQVTLESDIPVNHKT